MNDIIRVGLVDDHTLFLKGLKELINHNPKFQVCFTYTSGEELLNKSKEWSAPPEIVLLDMKMKAINGIETLSQIKSNFPNLHILILTMFKDDRLALDAIKNGAAGYLLKDLQPEVLYTALEETVAKGFYYTQEVHNMVMTELKGDNEATINDRETEFLKLVCTELTYKEIASSMYVSPRTVDGYRESLFNKLGVKSRTGLVLYALKRGIFRMEENS